jgi:phosphoglycolate phosphatase
LDRVLGRLGLDDYFHATRCADETRSKPHPLMLEQLMCELDIASEQVLMVGDTEYDLAMASAAGVASVGVSYGAHDASRLMQHDPIRIIDCFSELLLLP